MAYAMNNTANNGNNNASLRVEERLVAVVLNV